jgi:RHH-type proline utilization regulon transcriptional repressor/proline dehydrogenase/delta 1-pyrroline-5-carboxylate dehydrogenase
MTTPQVPHEPAALHIEPLSDFSREGARHSMRAALEVVAHQFGGSFPPVINNQPVAVPDFFDSLNPSHKRQIVGRCGRSTDELARQAIAAAARAFPTWRDTPVDRRARYLNDIATVLRRRRFELAAWQVYECAKQWREADADLAEAIDFCDFYAQDMLRLAAPRLRNVPGEDNAYFYEPRGVAVVIAPWNFPLAILTGMTTAALVAGNTVVMKPAEQSSVIAAKLMEVFVEVGLPPGVVNFLPGIGEEVGPALVGHPQTDIIAFTGSLKVGLLINEQAARTPQGQHHVKRVIAEMGGKNAIIVDDDSDMDEAVVGVIDSAFGYSGQKCSAGSRVIVGGSKYETFLARLVEAAKSMAIGPAEDPGSFVGPVIDEEAQRRLGNAIERGKKEARVVHSGDVSALADEGYYVAPHIFADVDVRSFLSQDEFFGPILAVMKSRDLNHALEIANGVPYALTGGVFSRSPANIARVKREFRVGNLYINRKITGALVDRQPFGGFKLSGIGSKAGGPDYLLQFLLPRTITENTLRRGFAPAEGSRQ